MEDFPRCTYLLGKLISGKNSFYSKKGLTRMALLIALLSKNCTEYRISLQDISTLKKWIQSDVLNDHDSNDNAVAVASALWKINDSLEAYRRANIESRG